MRYHLLQNLDQLVAQIALLLGGQGVPDLRRTERDEVERAGKEELLLGTVEGQNELVRGRAVSWLLSWHEAPPDTISGGMLPPSATGQ
jgi:hypothetical protein